MRCLADDECGFRPRKCGVWPRMARPSVIPARQTQCAPLPLVGRGWGWGSKGFARMAPPERNRITPLPNPPPAGCGLARFRQILEVTKPRQAGVWLGGGSTVSVRRQHREEILRGPDEIDHGGLVGMRR